MDFNYFKLSVTVLSFAFLNGCAVKKTDTANENILGNKLESIAPTKSADGTQKNTIVLFDETIQQIHEFDLSSLRRTRGFKVLNPAEKHFVLNDPEGRYIVDFSLKHISIFDKNSNAQHNPIQFLGRPVSSAFRPDLGLLIMYDDLKNIGILKLLPDGHVVQSGLFGSVVLDDKSISAGDLMGDGSLVLSLSDDSIIIVDVQQSLTQKQLVFTQQATTLSNISWIAPVSNSPNRIFMKTSTQAVLYDLPSASIVSQMAISDIEKLSKSKDPHMIDRVDSSTARLVYTDGISIKAVTLYKQTATILGSDLDLSAKTWTSVELNSDRGFFLFNDINRVREKRYIKRYQVPGMLALQSLVLPDEAQIKLGADYFFALYPSELGYAEKTQIQEGTTQILKQFNLIQF